MGSIRVEWGRGMCALVLQTRPQRSGVVPRDSQGSEAMNIAEGAVEYYNNFGLQSEIIYGILFAVVVNKICVCL